MIKIQKLLRRMHALRSKNGLGGDALEPARRQKVWNSLSHEQNRENRVICIDVRKMHFFQQVPNQNKILVCVQETCKSQKYIKQSIWWKSVAIYRKWHKKFDPYARKTHNNNWAAFGAMRIPVWKWHFWGSDLKMLVSPLENWHFWIPRKPTTLEVANNNIYQI